MIYGTPPIVTNGLVLNLDAANTKSYVSGSTVWRDMSGNNNSGSLVGGPTFSSRNGGSIVFDGIDDHVTGSLPTLANWTMCIWYLSTDITSTVVFYPYAGTSGANGLGFGGTLDSTTTNRWYFFDGSTVISSTSTAVTTNVWYNLVVTKSSTTYNLYTNGQLSLNRTGVDLPYTKYTLGRRGDSQPFSAKGIISSAMMYNRALTQAEVTQNYNALKSRFALS
jgi:hypothetical protein